MQEITPETSQEVLDETISEEHVQNTTEQLNNIVKREYFGHDILHLYTKAVAVLPINIEILNQLEGYTDTVAAAKNLSTRIRNELLDTMKAIELTIQYTFFDGFFVDVEDLIETVSNIESAKNNKEYMLGLLEHSQDIFEAFFDSIDEVQNKIEQSAQLNNSIREELDNNTLQFMELTRTIAIRESGDQQTIIIKQQEIKHAIDDVAEWARKLMTAGREKDQKQHALSIAKDHWTDHLKNFFGTGKFPTVVANNAFKLAEADYNSIKKNLEECTTKQNKLANELAELNKTIAVLSKISPLIDSVTSNVQYASDVLINIRTAWDAIKTILSSLKVNVGRVSEITDSYRLSKITRSIKLMANSMRVLQNAMAKYSSQRLVSVPMDSIFVLPLSREDRAVYSQLYLPGSMNYMTPSDRYFKNYIIPRFLNTVAST